MKYNSFMLHNFKNIPQLQSVSSQIIEAIEIVGSVLPFKTNNYVVDKLIDWNRVPDDPMFKLTFPQKEMLLEDDYAKMKFVIDSGADKQQIKEAANEIRLKLNPHPAGQLEHNVPMIDGEKTFWNAAQVSRNGFILSQPGSNLSCLLYLLFSMAAICWNGRS